MEIAKTALIILDGFGIRKSKNGNAIKNANTNFFKDLKKKSIYLELEASGNEVGLPKGYMGNSEVGHYTMGAGKIVNQSLENINSSINDNSFNKHEDLKKLKEHLNKTQGNLHLLGMISDKGVHSHINHLFEILKHCNKDKIKNVYIHAITDGRDSRERSAQIYIKEIEKNIKKYKVGQILTVIGRYYAMDRDNNWERTQEAYDLIVNNKGENHKTAADAIKEAYKTGTKTDYYIKPYHIGENKVPVSNKDAFIFFNFRTDRASQITEAITKVNHPNIKQSIKKKPYFICFGPYSKTNPVMFPAPKITENLSQVLEDNKIDQLKIAETEKQAHVTFFFNSQRKAKYKKEKRIIIPSPKVKSFDLKPEMSANEITTEIIKAMKNKEYHFIASNYANCDLVGHSGSYKATIKAVECLAGNLEKILEAAKEQKYNLIITADHGNAEEMLTHDNKPNPSHTTNKVPCYIIINNNRKYKINNEINTAGLKNIAATVLKTLKIRIPKNFNKSLIT